MIAGEGGNVKLAIDSEGGFPIFLRAKEHESQESAFGSAMSITVDK